MSEFQKSQMNPRAFNWVMALLVWVAILGYLGSVDVEGQELAAEHKKETIAAMQAEAKEKQDLEEQKIALYAKGQYMTGFGAMKQVASK